MEGSDADRLLDFVGVALVVFVVFGMGLLGYVLATGTPIDESAPTNIQWEIERVNDTHVEVVHAQGPTVDARNVSIVVDDEPRPHGWTGEVGPGNSTAVRAGYGSFVEVYWAGGEEGGEVLAESPV